MIPPKRIEEMSSELDALADERSSLVEFTRQLLAERKQLVNIAYAAENVQDKTIGLEWSCDKALTKALKAWKETANETEEK